MPHVFEVGESIKTVQAILGHSDVETTLNTCMHAIPDTQRRAVDRVTACLTIGLTLPNHASRLSDMVVHLKPETESRLQELAATTGRAPDELVEDAMTGYLAELTQVRTMLDGRYDEIKNGRVQPIDGEEAFARLREKSRDRRRS